MLFVMIIVMSIMIYLLIGSIVGMIVQFGVIPYNWNVINWALNQSGEKFEDVFGTKFQIQVMLFWFNYVKYI